MERSCERNPWPPRWGKPRLAWLLIGAGLVACYAAGLGLRRSVYEAQVRAIGFEPPFTLESALYFRRVAQVYDTGRLITRDPAVETPEGIVVPETYSVGSEFVYARLARLFPATMPLAERLRWLECGWFCLGIPLMAVWIGRWRRSVIAGAFAGLTYAVMLAAIIRSTGQELSRENFALPLLIGCWALQVFAASTRRGAVRWVLGMASAVSLALAWSSCDMIRYVLGLWLLGAWAAWLLGRWSGSRWTVVQGAMYMAALAAAALLNPYHRAHGAAVSPLLWAGAALVLAAAVYEWPYPPDRQPGRFGTIRRWALGMAVLVVALAGARQVGAEAVGASYGHFLDLLEAKVMHLNQKPADPSLLTFDQRIMWVPALHSANWQLTADLFPCIVWASLLGGFAFLASPRHRADPGFIQLAFFCVATTATYVFFVRFHVILAIFVAALTGVLAAGSTAWGGWRQWVCISAFSLGLVVEAGRVLSEPEKLGRTGVYYPELVGLTDWLREHGDGRTVLANFGTSGAILAYAGCPIVLHPKFETASIRERVEDYGAELFMGTERSFRDWADRFGVTWYVHGKGEFARRGVTQQMRYFVDALDPPVDAPARRFEAGDPTLRYFREVWSNRKYAVYRMRSHADEVGARIRAARSEEAFERGEWSDAERLAQEALGLDQTNVRALRIADLVTRLRAKGVANGP